MDYRKILKYIFIVLITLTTIFTVIYYTAITRADDTPLPKEDIGIEGTNLDRVLNYIEDFFKKEKTDLINTASVVESKKINNVEVSSEKKLEDSKQLNRKLLDECLARAENEWEELQNHYDEVLNDCVILDLGLNGGKLFNISECENKILPTKIKDKERIQENKKECFESYSKRQ